MRIEKKESLIYCVIAVVCFLAVVVVGLYVSQFYNTMLSTTSGDWGDFGGYVGGTLGPLLSTATIIFMYWSFKTQLRVFEKQQKEDKKNEECRVIVERVTVLTDKFESICLQQANLSEVAKSYLSYYFLPDNISVDFKVLDIHTLQVGKQKFSGATMAALNGLEKRNNADMVCNFLQEVQGSTLEYSARQAGSLMQHAIFLSIKALKKDCDVDVLQTLLRPQYPYVRSLMKWCCISEEYMFLLNLILKLPTNRAGLRDCFNNIFITDLIHQKCLNNKLEEFEVFLDKEGSEIEKVTITNIVNGDSWVQLDSGDWKKIAS